MPENQKKTPKLYFNGEDRTSKGYEKINDPKEINLDVLKKELHKQIKKEIDDVEEPEHAIGIGNGRLQLVRPEKTIELLQTSKQEKEVMPKPINMEKRIPTGIIGLDEVMEGGFREGSTNLVGGGAGSGKSIFCMQFLAEGIRKYDENGIYISFEQSEEKVLKDFNRFDWDLRGMIEKKKLTLGYYSPEQVQKVLETGGGIIRDIIEATKAKRLVIDSLTAFTLLFDGKLEKRKAILKLMEASSKWGVTTLMTSEHEPDPYKHESNVVEFEVDGVVLLYNIRKGDVRERSIEIYKMRGTKHAAKIFPMKIDEEGITIYPEETVF